MLSRARFLIGQVTVFSDHTWNVMECFNYVHAVLMVVVELPHALEDDPLKR